MAPNPDAWLFLIVDRSASVRTPTNLDCCMALKWLKTIVSLLPLLELVVFVLVALKFGFLTALALAFATSLIGILLINHAGRAAVARLRAAVADGQLDKTKSPDRVMFTAIAGILLAIPGFVTDVVGLILLLPPVQDSVRATLGRLLGRPPQDEGVVDLAPGEWRRTEENVPQRPRLPGSDSE
jgi:UPF0716 protein FxsA